MGHDMENTIVVQFFANSRFFVCVLYSPFLVYRFRSTEYRLLIGTASIEESEAEFVDDIAEFIIVS